MLDVQNLDLASNSFILFGNLLLLGNTFSFGLHLVLLKSLLQRIKATIATTWTFLFGSPILIIVAAVFVNQVNWTLIPYTTWLILLFCAVFMSCGGYVLGNWAVKKTMSPTIATIYICVQPITATIYDVILQGESIAIHEWIGGALIILGLLGVIRAKFIEDKKTKGFTFTRLNSQVPLMQEEVELEQIQPEDELAGFEQKKEVDLTLNPMDVRLV